MSLVVSLLDSLLVWSPVQIQLEQVDWEVLLYIAYLISERTSGSSAGSDLHNNLHSEAAIVGA